jgi:hypothetical protein
MFWNSLLRPHPTLSKGEDFKKKGKSKVLSFGEDLGEALNSNLLPLSGYEQISPQ